jgi:hypothetical protein
MGQLEGRTAIVTGAARGQGEAEARLFAAGPRGTAMTCTGVNMAPRPDVTQHLVVVLPGQQVSDADHDTIYVFASKGGAPSSPASLTHHPPDQDHACRLRICAKELGKPHCSADKRKNSRSLLLYGRSHQPLRRFWGTPSPFFDDRF